MENKMHYLTLSELSVSLRTKAISPVELVKHMINRIDALEPQLESYVTITAQRALEQAERAEREIGSGQWRGPLHGVPLAYKDIFYTDFALTTAGTAIHKSFQPTYSATAVRRLEAAGAVSLGKLKTTEQAWTEHHPTVVAPKNPWGAELYAGASSSGSGVATAAGLTFGALGSDTGGSIRFPSAVNGVTGLKPTWGRVSRHGVFELAASLDHVGPMTRSAVDCAIMLGTIAGADPADLTAVHDPVENYEVAALRSVAGMRVGLPSYYATDGVDPSIVAVWRAAAKVFEDLGAIVEEISFPEWRKAASTWQILLSSETALAHAATYPSKSESYGPVLSALIDLGRSSTAMDLAAAHHARLEFSNQLRAQFNNVDIILVPVTLWPTPTVAALTDIQSPLEELLRFTCVFDSTGSPTLTLPGGFDDRGAPMAIQLIGAHFDEAAVLQAGAAFQRATDWHSKHSRHFP
jgi:amidase